jgi:hypothetical protein
MIRLATDRVVALGRSRGRWPPRRGGKRPHVATLYRWAKDGVLADDGTVVVLETIRVGRTLCTSDEAIQRFCERLTAGSLPRDEARPRSEALRADPALEDQARARGL